MEGAHVTWCGRVGRDGVEFWAIERLSSVKLGWPQASCLLLVSCSWLRGPFCFCSSNFGNSVCFLGASHTLPGQGSLPRDLDPRAE